SGKVDEPGNGDVFAKLRTPRGIDKQVTGQERVAGRLDYLRNLSHREVWTEHIHDFEGTLANLVGRATVPTGAKDAESQVLLRSNAVSRAHIDPSHFSFRLKANNLPFRRTEPEEVWRCNLVLQFVDLLITIPDHDFQLFDFLVALYIFDLSLLLYLGFFL